jgi:hypothetical protein
MIGAGASTTADKSSFDSSAILTLPKYILEWQKPVHRVFQNYRVPMEQIGHGQMLAHCLIGLTLPHSISVALNYVLIDTGKY